MVNRVYYFIITVLVLAMIGSVAMVVYGLYLNVEMKDACRVECDKHRSIIIDGECYCKTKMNSWDRPL